MDKRLRRMFRKKNLKTVLSFLIVFNLLSIPIYLVIITDYSFQPLQGMVASITTALLEVQGYSIVQNGQFMVVAAGNGIYRVEVSWDSTGWKSVYALFALVMATPVSTLWKKLRFLAIGLPAIFALNIARIVTTMLIAITLGFQYFDIVHTVLWREGLIIAVVLVWYIWLKKEKYNIRYK